MGCGASAASIRRKSAKRGYNERKKTFMKSPTVRFLKEVQDLVKLAKGITHLVQNEEKVKANLQVFAQAMPIFAKSSLTKPFGQLLKRIPEVLNPLIEQNRWKMMQLQPIAQGFLHWVQGFHCSILELFNLIKHAEKRKVVDKVERYQNASRMLAFFTTHLETEVKIMPLGEHYKPILKIIRSIDICEKIGKTVKFLVKLLTKKIPFVKKSVIDFLSTGSVTINPIVIAAKLTIKAALYPFKRKIDRLADTGLVPLNFAWPYFEIRIMNNLIGLNLVKTGKKILDVKESLPKEYQEMEIEDNTLSSQLSGSIRSTFVSQQSLEGQEQQEEEEEQDDKQE